MATNVCDAVLNARMTLSEDTKSRLNMAWLNIINSDNYDSEKTTGSATYGDMFSGDYENFKQKRAKFFSEQNFNLNTDQSRSMLLSQPGNGAIQAWSDCQMTHDGGLWCHLEDITDTSATLIVNWRSPVGIGALTHRKVSLVQPAAIVPGEDEYTGNNKYAGGQTTVMLSRSDRTVTFSGSVTGTAAGADGSVHYADTFLAEGFVPPIHVPHPSESYPVNVGTGVKASVTIPAAEWQREFDIAFHCSAYYKPGDPWMQMTITIDGVQENPITSNFFAPIQDINATRYYVLPANKSVKIEATTTNFHADAKELSINAVSRAIP